MKTRIFASVGIAILVAIVVTAIVVANPLSTQAAPDSDTESKPYIGVAIYPLPDGTVKVAKVLEGGPSDGVLEDGDIITAVNGETIDGAKDLTDAIADAGVGASLALTITRGGSNMDVSVTVGEWEGKKLRRGGRFHKAGGMKDRFASSRIVMADDDGNYHTYRHRKGRMYKFGPGGARHQSFFQRFDPGDVRIEIKRVTVGDSS